MRITIKMMAVILVTILVISLTCAIVVPVDAAQDYPLKIWKQNENGRFMTLNVVDEKTGVNYIVVSAESCYGDYTTTVAITPRLNADGSLYVTP